MRWEFQVGNRDRQACVHAPKRREANGQGRPCACKALPVLLLIPSERRESASYRLSVSCVRGRPAPGRPGRPHKYRPVSHCHQPSSRQRRWGEWQGEGQSPSHIRHQACCLARACARAKASLLSFTVIYTEVISFRRRRGGGV